jgi:glycine/D-amino acid oxidase-like deaminating enzyme
VETLDVLTESVKWEAALEEQAAREEILQGNVETGIFTKHRVWSATWTREELLIPEGVGAISFSAYALSPYKFVCALLEICIKKGLNLQMNTPVVEVSQYPTCDSKKEWIVHTDRGNIRASKLILATNAYTGALHFASCLVHHPTRAQVASLRPGSRIVNNPALKRTMI